MGVKEDKLFEATVITAFVDFLNEKKNINLQFACCPDEQERNKPAPDFKYTDGTTGQILFIEVGRITDRYLGDIKKELHMFAPIKQQLEGCLKGSFLLIIDRKLIPKIKKTKQRKKYLLGLSHNIKIKSDTMSLGDKIDIQQGIALRKYSNDNSTISIPSSFSFISLSDDPQYMLDLFRESNEKFATFKADNCHNVLVILDGISTWHDIVDLIQRTKAGFYGENVEFTYLNEIYEISFDLGRWNDKNICVSRCYPHPMSQNLCSPSKLFKNQTEYTNTILKYFMALTE
jgi:hypothetical protein